MKFLVATFLVLSLLLQSWGKTIVLVHFYTFRKEITEKECVNKIRPVTMCYGSCVLAKKMKDDGAEKRSRPLPPVLKTLKESVLFNETAILYTPAALPENRLLFPGFPQDIATVPADDIFHPPLS